MKKLILTASLALFAIGANASGLTNSGTLTQVNVSGKAQIKGTMTGNPDGCASSATYVLAEDNPNFKNILASVLTAYASGNDVRFFVNGCVTPGATEYPNIQSMVLQ